MNKLHDLVEEMEDVGVFEDRREYTVEDLKLSYQLTDQEAQDLYYLIQRRFDPHRIDAYEVNRPNQKDGVQIDPNLVLEGIQEALHGSLDGWDSEHDRIVIERFIDDLMLYAHEARKYK